MYLKNDTKFLKLFCICLTTFHLLSLKLKMVLMRPYKKISVFQVKGLKILGRVRTKLTY